MSVSSRLRDALLAALAAGQTRYSISKRARVDHANLTRFVRGHRDIRISTADKLAQFVGLELAPKKGETSPE